jgi:large subunit ribosomal protein L6
MSRVGNNPVEVPSGVEVAVSGRVITAKGKLGEMNASKRARALWGTTRARIQNMVTGVSEGFIRKLEINGVGYRATVQGSTLHLQLGYSHDINYAIPDGITIQCEKPTSIAVSGADKQKVGQVAAEIRGYRKPEPYKGKGIKYVEETILRKEGKKK